MDSSTPLFLTEQEHAIAEAFERLGNAISVAEHLDLPYLEVRDALFDPGSPLVMERARRMRENETALIDEFLTNLVFSMAALRAKIEHEEPAISVTAASQLGRLSMKGMEFVAKHGRRAAETWQELQRQVDAMSYGELATKLEEQAGRYRRLEAANGAVRPLGPGGEQ